MFSKKINISTIDQQDNIPYSEILDIQEIYTRNDKNTNDISALVLFCDNRTIFYNILKTNSIAYITTFFPLSREKYKMKALVYALDGSNDSNVISPGDDERKRKQLESYLNLNKKYVNTFYNSGNENNKSEFENFNSSFVNELKEQKIEKLLNQYWSRLNNEEKLDYDTVDKDSMKECGKKHSEKKDVDVDLDKFEAQEEIFYTKHFSVLYLIPVDVEHTILPMPQVVANSRKHNFESLMKPHKKTKKYFFIFDFESSQWKFTELN